MDATRWTPEFRRALDALLSGAPDDVIAELDAAAIDAARRVRAQLLLGHRRLAPGTTLDVDLLELLTLLRREPR
jgi:hypothetical protein